MEIKTNFAEANAIQGVYIFADSRPLKEYQYLGTVKVVLTFRSGQYQDIRDKLLKKVKSKYPTANGMIIHFNEMWVDKADAILIK